MKQLKPIRSFVRRYRNLSVNKQKIFDEMWLKYGLEVTDKQISSQKTFGNNAPLILEIGFGNGETIFSLAQQYPAKNFIGIEIHKPGITHLFNLLKKQPLNNIKIYNEDALIIFQQCVQEQAVDKILILFPDPWQKRRHHKRRLIQPQFIDLVYSKLKPNGILHIATDWEDYANHIISIFQTNSNFIRQDPAKLSLTFPERPILTKFEERGKKLGHKIVELLFVAE